MILCFLFACTTQPELFTETVIVEETPTPAPTQDNDIAMIESMSDEEVGRLLLEELNNSRDGDE